MSWTTPAELRRQVERLWNSGAILRAPLAGDALFPRRLRLKRPSSGEVADRFGEVQDWIRRLRDGSREARGFGYSVEWRQVNHRVHGTNTLPEAAIVPDEADALALIGRTADAGRFRGLVTTTLERFPQLGPWLASRPLTALDHASRWERILDVVAWFAAHPRPGLYLRQLDVPGVDTKFIEGHRKLLAELLDLVLTEDAVDRRATGVRGFERRYGLRSKPPLIRFRILDERLYLRGLSDICVPPAQFAKLAPPVRRVFITENEINGLAFPDLPESLVIFGLGYGLDRLADIGWLRNAELHYWGDIDTHGFAILHRLRSAFPHARSFLMDRATLEAHRHLWVKEPRDFRFEGTLNHLDAAESALFDDLRHNRLGERVRLEQERIAYGWLEQALGATALPTATPPAPRLPTD